MTRTSLLLIAIALSAVTLSPHAWNARAQQAGVAEAKASALRTTHSALRTQEPAVRADYPIRAVPLTAVRLTDAFWRPRLEINRTVTIPHILRQNEQTGRVDNFLKAARTITGPYQGQRYNDTDVYKIIEAASYALAAVPDPALDRKLDDLIAIIAAAQEPDGYLYTPRSVDPKNPAPGAGPERWSWLHTSHELYDQGHMIEAAVAHFQATGKRTLLNIAIKSADLISTVFGPAARHDVPGHQEIELALVKLFRATGNRTYLDRAKFFLDQRGRPHTIPPAGFEPGSRFAMYNDLAYRQDDRPTAGQTRAVGHAVRAMYFYIGMIDTATLLDDPVFTATVKALWTDITWKRMYLTGGLGSQGRTEAFGDDYVLPNRAYAETCASIGGMLWYHRMFLREGDAAYYDTFERTLYNGFLSGVSLAGDMFFYQNPLVSDGTVARSAYFDVACCPANLSRLMAQLPGLIYAQRDDEIFVNLFVGSEADIAVDTQRVRLTQQTDYPWNGRVTITVDPDVETELTLALRIPGWSRGEAMPAGNLYRFASTNGTPNAAPTVTVNGRAVPLDAAPDGVTAKAGRGPADASGGTYARIHRRWRKGDVVQLELPMPIRRVLAHDDVAEDRGKAAIQRGPVIYALEGIDNGNGMAGIRLPVEAELQHHFDRQLLGGVEVVTGKNVIAVPYFAWANRGKGQMAVWIPYQ